MAKMTLLFLFSVIVTCAVNRTFGMGNYGYYLSGYPAIGGDLLSFGPVLQPDCDKSKESSEGSSGESSGEGSKEGGSSSEESKEGETSSKIEEGGSKEEKKEEGKSEESGGGEIKEKKEAPEKKESKEVSPPSYTFPPRQMQQIVYSAGAPYNYMPYRYVVQQPVDSSPLKTNYQYFSLPSSATVSNIYAPPVVNRILPNSVARIVYSSPGFNYPSVSKTILTPGAQVYSNPVTWNSPVSYYKM